MQFMNIMHFFTLKPLFLFVCLFFRNGRAPQHQADFDPGQRPGVQSADADREQVILMVIFASLLPSEVQL